MVRRKRHLSRLEETRMCRVNTGLGTLNLMHARYVTQTFAPHFHEGYCLGVIERGALGFRYMGETVVAPAGAVNLAIPGEVHTGQAADESGWTYRMFYLDVDLLVSAVSQITGKDASLPFIRDGVIFDHELARMIHCLHRRMEDPRTPVLEKETGLLAVLVRVIRRYSQPRPAARGTGREPGAVASARDYIHARHNRDISIRELATLTGLSPYHFIRVFYEALCRATNGYVNALRRDIDTVLEGFCP